MRIITVIALDNINNAGDEILNTSTRWLIKQTNTPCVIETKKFDPTDDNLGGV